jgi:hypothetical protein
VDDNGISAALDANADLFEYICQDNNHGPELMLGTQSEVDNDNRFVP